MGNGQSIRLMACIRSFPAGGEPIEQTMRAQMPIDPMPNPQDPKDALHSHGDSGLMPYVSAWELLPDAIKRVTVGGRSKDMAEADLCRPSPTEPSEFGAPHGLERLGIDQQSPANRSIAISVKPSTAPIVLS